MSPLDYLWVALAGSAGALARFVVDGQVSGHLRALASRREGGGFRGALLTRVPIGIMLINVTGSLLLGFFVGLVTFDGRSDLWKTVAGTGFCGGYTTFSTASVETVRLIQDRAYRPALLSGGGTLVLTVGAAALGMVLSQV